MSNLIPVFQADSQQLLCNARDLHAFLEVGRDFSNWIKDRIKKYDFVEGEDYLTVGMAPGQGHQTAPQNGGAMKSTSYDHESVRQNWRALESITYAEDFGQQGRIEYHLTIGMAKELAMIENNAMGRRVRRYFIQRERQAMELLQQQATEVQPLEQVRKRIKDTPKFRDLMILQEQSRATARELARCQAPREAFNLHCMLRQINNALGIPTEPLEVWNGGQALTSDQES